MRYRIKNVPVEEFQEIVEGFATLKNVVDYIGIQRLTPYVEKVLKTRIKELSLTQGLTSRKDGPPAQPAPPGAPEEEEPDEALPSAIAYLQDDEEELNEYLQHKLEKLEGELEVVHGEIEERQEKRNLLVKKINKLRAVIG